MKPLAAMLLMLLLALPPALRADDKNDDKDKAPPAAAEKDKKDGDKKDADKKDKKDDRKKDEDSPIPRLVELRLDEFVVPARAINLPFSGGRTQTVQEILNRFEDWARNERIGGVLLNIGDLNLAIPDVEELRDGLQRLRKSEKKIRAFLNGGGPESYLLACMADEIAVPPTGSVMIPGLGRAFAFQRGALQMQGIEVDVISCGRFKYPGFMNRREPTEAFVEEFNTILDSWIDDYKGMIARGRKLSKEVVNEAVDAALFNAVQAQQRGLVDTLAYYDEYRDRLVSRYKMKLQEGDERDFSNVNSLQDLVELINRELRKAEEARKAVGPKIAVLHARGPIIDGSVGAGLSTQLIAREDFVKVVNELRENKSIKAVVMRIDSPGGSGYASDIIWRELRRLDEAKPLVASMGTVAGSGGYFIAVPARRIFAQPTTITGSIGVLGMIQNAQSLINRRDLNIYEMARGARALFGSPTRPFSKEDRGFLQKYMDDFYDIFIDRVAQGRKMPAEQVRKLAEGRIYTGRQALAIGLVDELGGLDDAIQSARKMANIPPSAELKIIHYPRPSSLGELFENIGSISAATPAVERAVQSLTRAVGPAQLMSFEEQVLLFSARPQALCWMPLPTELYAPPRQPSALIHELVGPRP